MNDPTTELRVPVEPKKGGKGKYVAIGCAGVLLVTVIGGYLAYRGVTGFISGIADQYTSTEQIELPDVDVTDEEAAVVLERVAAFTGVIKADGPTPPSLVLTSQDINTLIQQHPDWSELAGKVHVSIEGDRIHGQTSIPLERFGSLFAGRFLNAEVDFRLELTAGRLLAFIDAAEMAGQPLPESFMDAIRAKNLAEDTNQNAEFAATLEKLESITVRDDSITIVPKTSP